MKDFVAINLLQHLESIREEQNIRKFAKSLYILLTTPDQLENNQILLIIAYIAIMLSFSIFLIQSYNWLTLIKWLKSN